MSVGGDRFEIINGPEDGTECPIGRSPFDIGSDPGCAVAVRLDDGVKRFHARATTVAGGYRIRRVADAPVWVNGKKVGRVQSRIAREKDIVKVGRTEIMIRTSEGGLASRSRGMPTESDFAWTFREASKFVTRFAKLAFRIGKRGVFSKFFLAFIAIGVAYVMSPTARRYIDSGFAWSKYYAAVGWNNAMAFIGWESMFITDLY